VATDARLDTVDHVGAAETQAATQVERDLEVVKGMAFDRECVLLGEIAGGEVGCSQALFEERLDRLVDDEAAGAVAQHAEGDRTRGEAVADQSRRHGGGIGEDVGVVAFLDAALVYFFLDRGRRIASLTSRIKSNRVSAVSRAKTRQLPFRSLRAFMAWRLRR
jgi:hypothetical protein